MNARKMALIIGVGLVLIGSLFAAPDSPLNFYGDSPTADSITWNWGDVLDEDGYCVHDNSEEMVGEVGADVESYTETGLDENTEYERHCHSFTAGTTGIIEDVTVGNETTEGGIPIDAFFPYSRCQMLYLQSEINKSGKITKIRFYNRSQPGFSLVINSCSIYMYETDDATLSGWVGGDSGPGTEVFNGDLTMPSSSGWYEITLTTPFSYSNTKNLLVSFRNQWGMGGYFLTWNTTDIDDVCVLGIGYSNPPTINEVVDYRPNVQFEIDCRDFDLSDPSNSDFAYSGVHNPDASDFMLENIGGGQVRITVTPPPNSTEDYTGVEIERATDSGFSDTTTIQSFTANYTLTDGSLADAVYWYRITFCNGDGVPTNASEGVSINLSEEPPVAEFSADFVNGIAPQTVQFTDESTGQIDSWSWDFDGDSVEDSTEQNPSHVYTAAGTYTVSLTVTGQGGSDTETKTDYITVIEYTELLADFSADPTSGAAPLTVQFTDESLGEISSWSWDFDGDSVEDSTEQNPSHVYTAPGTYTVSLTVTGTAGSDTETKTDYITVTDGSSVHADFSATPTNGPAPLNVTFTNLSTGVHDSWYWNFGDGNTSREENPVHTYGYGGTYTVYLIIDGPEGMDDEVKTDYITVTGDPPPPPPPATEPKDSDKGGCSCSLDRKPVAPRNLVGYLMPLLLLVGVCLVLRRRKCSA